MADIELISDSENVESYDNSLNKELIDLSLNTLEGDIKSPAPGEFKSLGDTNDKNFSKYLYKVKNGGTPDAIRNIAIKAGLTNSKDGIQITNSKAQPYNESHRFSAGDEVYIRIPKLKSNWENPDYFDSTKKIETDNTYKNKGIVLKRDVGMTFYVMNTNDIKYTTKKNKKIASRTETINYLRQKLGNLEEFSYLKRNEYAPGKDVTQTFNIRPDFDKYLQKHPETYFIPIPMDSEKRKIDDKKFKSYAKDGVDELCKKDDPYGKYWKGLNKSKLAAFFTAIAKVETGKTTQKIGTDEYHRRETGNHNCFSFGPHHVLMEGPGKTAYNKLKDAGYFSTEGQTYHPKNSTMRCMGFIVEKMRDIGKKEADISKEISNMLSFFKKSRVTGNDFKKFAQMYNGSGYAANKYHTKFATAYNLVK